MSHYVRSWPCVDLAAGQGYCKG